MKPILNFILFLFLNAYCFAQSNIAANHGQENDQQNITYLQPAFQLSLKAAMEITGIARSKAFEIHKDIAVAVVNANGQLIILSRGDEVGVHNVEAARRKAFTAVSTKTATLVLGRNAKANPDTQNLANMPELLVLGGGFPIFYQGKVIGAIGVAGGGGPENDDRIAKAAVLKFTEQIIN